MSDFKKYKRIEMAEMRPITRIDIANEIDRKISVSTADMLRGSPKIGDMIARNPDYHDDQWLVAEKSFKKHFELLEGESDEWFNKI